MPVRSDDVPAKSQPPSGDDLLAGLGREGSAEDQPIPDWVARIMGLSASGPDAESPREQPGPFPTEEESFEAAKSAEVSSGVQGDQAWSTEARDLSGEESEGAVSEELGGEWTDRETGSPNSEIYQWLKQLDALPTESDEPELPNAIPASEDVPTWVDRMLGVTSLAEEGAPVSAEELPDWLKEPPAGVPGPLGTPSGPPDERSAGSAPTDLVPADSGQATVEVAPGSGRPPEESPAGVSAFPAQEMERLDVDALFASMRMPDWLAELDATSHPASQEQMPAAEDEDRLVPADLPSWVADLRPMDELVGQTDTRIAEGPSEESGPLLGLHGVLPAIPGAALVASKPLSQSSRIETSDEQQLHARLLEDMLANETRPLPLRGVAQPRSLRALRWALSALVVALVTGTIFAGSSIFPLPDSVPNESAAAIHAVQSLAPDARVLAVFDYNPATAGEMQATAASLMDHLLLLKHPRLAILSTSPTGSALAEQFMLGTLSDRGYVRDVQYVDLGYLAGGLAGVRTFAQDPTSAVPLGASMEQVWDSAVLAGAQRLSDFATIMVLTDSLESGRVWIEQTAASRGSSRMVIISSAQSGPMLLPYFDSGQIDGLVAGLNGAVGPEIANAGSPGIVRRYWDAYNIGLYAAALIIIGAAFWSMWSALQERRRGAA